MNILGLITARGGSKSIPRKNLARCGGQPLLYWTCAAAREARAISRSIISSDDPEITRYAESQGIEAPFIRPAEFATDMASSIDVAQHAIRWLAEREGWQTDVLILLQPTSPLRTARHIDEAFALLSEIDNSVVSVVEVPHCFNPWSVMVIEKRYLHNYHQGELSFDPFRRQGQPVLYARNGPAVVVSRSDLVMKRTLYGRRCRPYPMSSPNSIDIDEPDDLILADCLLRRRTA